MKKAAILALAAALVIPAVAAEEKKEGGEAKKGGKPGTNVDMPYLMAPLNNADGKLTGYAYISARLTASSEGNALVVREKLPFIQDAFVRDVNKDPLAGIEKSEDVDVPTIEARLLADARRVIGTSTVKQLIVCTVQVASLHPSPNPPAASPPPGAAPAKAPEKSRCES